MNVRKKCSLAIAGIAGYVLTMVMAILVQAQDGEKTERTLAQCQAAWTELAAKFEEVETRISAGGDDAKQARREFSKLAKQSKALVEEIETAAKAELEQDRTSSNALRALMGMAMQSAAKDQDWKTLELGDYLIQKGISPKYFEVAAKSESLSIEQKQIFDELLIRQAESLKNDLPRVELKTSKGTVVVELFENEAPGTVGNFVFLAENGYFDNMLFHRVIEGFMAQSGGYKLDESGERRGGEGPGYEIKCECYEPNARKHFTGCLSMAKKADNRGTIKNSGGSEFYVTLVRTDGLDGEHTVFGRVLSGYPAIENLERTHLSDRDIDPMEGVIEDKIISAKVLRKRAHKYQPDRVNPKQNSSATEASPAASEGQSAEPVDDGGPSLTSPK